MTHHPSAAARTPTLARAHPCKMLSLCLPQKSHQQKGVANHVLRQSEQITESLSFYLQVKTMMTKRFCVTIRDATYSSRKLSGNKTALKNFDTYWSYDTGL